MKSKRIPFILLCLVVILISNCSRDKTPCACGIENPQTNIEWLKSLLSRTFCVEVYVVSYNNEEYIGIRDCPRIVDGMTVIYDCSGNKISEFGGLFSGSGCTLPDFWNYFEINKKLIYVQDIKP